MPNTNFSIKSYFDQLDQSQQSFRTLMGLFSVNEEDEKSWLEVLEDQVHESKGFFKNNPLPMIDLFTADHKRSFRSIMLRGSTYDTNRLEILPTDFHIAFSTHIFSHMKKLHEEFHTQYQEIIERIYGANLYDPTSDEFRRIMKRYKQHPINIHRLSTKASVDVEKVIPLQLTQQSNDTVAYYFCVEMYSNDFGHEKFIGFVFNPKWVLTNEIYDILERKKWIRRTV